MPNAIIEAESRLLPVSAPAMPAPRSKAEVVASVANVTISKTGDVAIELLRNPIFSMVLATALVEALQRVRVGTGEYGWVNSPNAPVSQWTEIKTPLLSQGLATTLESVLITSKAIESFGGLGGIAGLLGKLIG